MPKLPLHQLDSRIKASVLDVEGSKGIYPTLTDRLNAVQTEVIEGRGLVHANLNMRFEAIEGLMGATQPSTLMQSQTIKPVGGETILPLPATYDPLASVLIVYRNGQLVHETDDYTLSETQLTFLTALYGTEIVDLYWYEVPNSGRYLRITADGVSTTYTVGAEMIGSNSQLLVTVNGLLKIPGPDYAVGTDTITFAVAPADNGAIELRKLVFFGSSSGWAMQYAAGGGEATLTLPHAYIPGAHHIFVFRNGLLQRPGAIGDYVELDAQTIQFNFALLADDAIYVIGSTRAFDRLAKLENNLRIEQVKNLRQGIKIVELSQRFGNTIKSFSEGGINANLSHGAGFTQVDDFLVNVGTENILVTLSVPVDASGTATGMYVQVAGNYTNAPSVGGWMVPASIATFEVPPSGLLAGWSVLYR